MDRSEDSPEHAHWVTLEQAAELVRAVSPGTRSLLEIKTFLASRAVDQTLLCRDPRRGRIVTPRAFYGPDDGGQPHLSPQVEIELASLWAYLLHLHATEKWPTPVEDILSLGTEGFDPAEVLQRRLLASACEGRALAERGNMAAPAAAQRKKGGRRIKAAIPAAMVEATLKLLDEGSASDAEVARWITKAVENRNESIAPSQATEYAGIVLRLHKAWQNPGN